MATLTEDQAAIYDRQLRVWGVEVQNRLTSARILVAGFSRLAAEITKNLVLAGVGHVAFLAEEGDGDLHETNFLVSSDAPRTSSRDAVAVAVRTLSDMNPLVNVQLVEGSLDDAIQSKELQKFDLLLVVDKPLRLSVDASQACHEQGIKFFLAAIRGPIAYSFADLQRHTYLPKGEEGKAKGGAEIAEYVPLGKALATPLSRLNRRSSTVFPILKACSEFETRHGRVPGPDDVADLDSLARQLAEESGNARLAPPKEQVAAFVLGGAEFAPLAAVLGGVVANSVIKTVSGKGLPLKNFFFYSLFDSVGLVEDLC